MQKEKMLTMGNATMMVEWEKAKWLLYVKKSTLARIGNNVKWTKSWIRTIHMEGVWKTCASFVNQRILSSVVCSNKLEYSLFTHWIRNCTPMPELQIWFDIKRIATNECIASITNGLCQKLPGVNDWAFIRIKRPRYQTNVPWQMPLVAAYF